jgi:hypothetical protein
MKIDRDAVVLSQGDNNCAANTAFAHENNSRQQLCGKTRRFLTRRQQLCGKTIAVNDGYRFHGFCQLQFQN